MVSEESSSNQSPAAETLPFPRSRRAETFRARWPPTRPLRITVPASGPCKFGKFGHLLGVIFAPLLTCTYPLHPTFFPPSSFLPGVLGLGSCLQTARKMKDDIDDRRFPKQGRTVVHPHDDDAGEIPRYASTLMYSNPAMFSNNVCLVFCNSQFHFPFSGFAQKKNSFGFSLFSTSASPPSSRDFLLRTPTGILFPEVSLPALGVREGFWT